MTFDIREYILEQNDARQTPLSEGKMSKAEGRAMLKKLMLAAAKKGMSEKEFWDYMDPKEWEDMRFPIREGIWDKFKGALRSGVNVVKDSEGRTGKAIRADRTHVTVRWEDGGTDKINFDELDRKGGAWFWQI